MVKKLLWYRFSILLSLFFWTAAAFGQCPESVKITADQSLTICEGTAITFTATPTGGEGFQY